MALSRTNVHGQITTTGGHGTGDYVTSTFTPPSNSLLAVSVTVVENSGSTTDPGAVLTVAGGGLTFTPRAAQTVSTASYPTATKVWTAPVGTASLMDITVSTGGRNIAFYSISVVAYTGYDTGSPIGATATGSQNGGFSGPPTPASITLSAAPATTSEVFAAVGMDKSNAGVTPGTGWTETQDLHNTGGSWGGLQTQVRTGSTSTQVDWDDLRSGSGALFNYAAAAIEIKAGSSTTPFTRDYGINWRVLNAFAKDTDLRWRVLAGFTKDTTLNWRVLAAFNRDTVVNWRVLNAFTKNVTVNWRVLASFTRDTALVWRVLGAWNKDVALAWRVLNGFTRDYGLLWNVDAGAAWNAVYGLQWRVLGAFTKDTALSWRVLATWQRDYEARWRVLAALQRDVDVRWRVLGAFGADTALAWRVLGSFARDYALAWRVLAAWQRDTVLLWNVLEDTAWAKDVQLHWRVRAALVRDYELRWRILSALPTLPSAADVDAHLVLETTATLFTETTARLEPTVVDAYL